MRAESVSESRAPGTVRELVSRNLSRLYSEGVIDIDERKVTIRDLKRPQAEVDSAE